MSDIERYKETDDWAPMMPQIVKISEYIAQTEFVPKGLRGRAPAVAAAILTGREVGLPPMTAMAHIDVIEGVPTMDPEMMRALVLREGHELRFVEMTKTRCVVVGRRKDEAEATRVTFTIDEAKDMGLASKKNWREQPQNMLVARATSRICRLLFPDVIGGLSYTPEEILGTIETEASEGEVVQAPVVAATPKLRRATKSLVPPPESHKAPVVEATEVYAPPLPYEEESAQPVSEVVEAPVEMATRPQLSKMAAAFGELGVGEREERLLWVSAVVGREITSSKDLTKTEAMKVIDRQERVLSGEPLDDEAPDEVLTGDDDE